MTFITKRYFLHKQHQAARHRMSTKHNKYVRNYECVKIKLHKYIGAMYVSQDAFLKEYTKKNLIWTHRSGTHLICSVDNATFADLESDPRVEWLSIPDDKAWTTTQDPRRCEMSNYERISLMI